MYHKGEFITCHYLSLWHPRWHFDPQRGHFTAVDFSVYVCTFAVFFPIPVAPRDKSVSHSDSSVHLQALNPTQHWLNLLSSVLFISIIVMADSFEIKFTYVFLLFSSPFFWGKMRNCISSLPLNSGRGKKKGKVLDWAKKEYFRSQPEPQWDPVRQRVEETLQK